MRTDPKFELQNQTDYARQGFRVVANTVVEDNKMSIATRRSPKVPVLG